MTRPPMEDLMFNGCNEFFLPERENEELQADSVTR